MRSLTTRQPWLVGAALLSVAGLLCYLAVWGIRYGLDLAVYRDAATTWIGGHDPYHRTFTVDHLPFTYPPFALAVEAWTTLVTLHTAQWLTWLLSILAASGAVVVVAHEQGLARGWSSWVASVGWVCAAMIALEPARSGMDYGQIEFLLMGMVVADLFLVPARHRGVVLGVAAAVKLTPLAFALVLLLRREFRATRRMALSFLVCSIVAGLVSPRMSASYWLHQALVASRTGTVTYRGNQCWYALANRTPFAGHASRAVWLGLCLVTLAIGVYVARRCVASNRQVFALVALALTGLLISPISWTHHWVWVLLIPPALVGRGRTQVGRTVRAMLWGLVSLTALAPYWWPASGALHVAWVDLLPVWTFVLLAVWALAEWRAARTPMKRTTAPPAVAGGAVGPTWPASSEHRQNASRHGSPSRAPADAGIPMRGMR